MKNLISQVVLLFFFGNTFAQQHVPVKINTQSKYNSSSRVFYTWNEEKQAYDPKDSEFENSVIVIRELNSKGNGYISISLNDDSIVRVFHGSIISVSVDENDISTWVIRSKDARGKVVLDPRKNIITYSYESNDTRYLKVFVFNIVYEQEEQEEN